MTWKMNNHLYPSVLLILAILFNGCGSGKNKNNGLEEKGTYLFSEEIHYAKGFNIDYYKEYTKVTINNPWQNNQEPYKV